MVGMLPHLVCGCLLISCVSAFSPSPAFHGRLRRDTAASRIQMTVDQVEARLTEAQKGGPYKPAYAPYITLFDSRGCSRPNTEYKGAKSGDMNDEQCIMIQMEQVPISEATARVVFYDVLPLFNNPSSRAIVANRIKKLNDEAKAQGLPAEKWPFPPGYLLPPGVKPPSIYTLIGANTSYANYAMTRERKGSVRRRRV